MMLYVPLTDYYYLTRCSNTASTMLTSGLWEGQSMTDSTPLWSIYKNTVAFYNNVTLIIIKVLVSV